MYCLVLVFMFLNKVQAEPFILNPLGTCDSPFGKHELFLRQTYFTSLDNYELFINLCESLPESYCGRNVKVCIRNKQNTSLVLAGDGFDKIISSGRDSMKVNISDSSLCRDSNVSVKFICSYDLIQQPKLLDLGNCKFEIQLFDPRPSACSDLVCVTTVHGNIINLMPLSKVYRGSSETFNYSVGFCTSSNTDCKGDNGITSCVYMNNGEYKPLVDSAVHITYENNKNQLQASGHYVSSKVRKMTIVLKCNWDKEIPEMSYPRIPIQGKKFKFVLESSYGCIKVPSSCLIVDGVNVYNFSSLSKRDHWSITSQDGMILFNVCGKLTLPKGKGCSGSAQVCETKGSRFINRGRLQVLRISTEPHMIFTDGDMCEKDANKRYETEIRFKCDAIDSGPRFNKTEDCLTTLEWSTPAACPIQDESKCAHGDRSYQKCEFEDYNLLYNFTGLVRKPDDYYILKDVQHGNVEFHLNLCKPVIDPEVPCQKNSMVAMKYLDQHDVTKRVVSLGNFSEFKAVSLNSSIIKSSEGTLCTSRDSLGHYQSIISLECSNEEEGPKYKEESDCTVYFQWRTPAACPKKIKTDQCILMDNVNDERLNLTSLKEKSLKIDLSNVSYVFDICDSYTDCSRQKGCEYVPLYNLTTIAKKRYLEFNLNRSCDTNRDFNRTLIELTCGHFTNNDHFIFKTVIDCVLKLELQTTLICSKEEEKIRNYNFSIRANTTSKIISPGYKRNCSVINNSTGYSLNIDKLKLNITSPTCPKFAFNRPYGVTELSFTTEDICRKTNSMTQNWTNLVELKCPTHTYQDVKAATCQNIVRIEDQEFCKLLEVREETNNTSLVLSIIIPILVFLLCIGTFVFYKSRSSPACIDSSRNRLLLRYGYDKEADL